MATLRSAMSETDSDALHLQQNFLAPSEMLAVLRALDRLSSKWTPSEALRLLGRGRTDQVPANDAVVRAALDQIREVLAPRALEWATRCGFKFKGAPHLQLFPVKMMGDPQTPAYQEPHHDTHDQLPRPPVCTNVFYAKVKGIVGGDLAVTPKDRPDSTDPILVPPTVNTIASFSGERVHWVQPLYSGERLSIVINFY
jgi:hypothetical protein